jgi:hypothetical protein
VELVGAARNLLRSAAFSFGIALVGTVFVLLVLSWDVTDTLIGAAVGTAVFGALKYWGELRHWIPYGSLDDAPQRARLNEDDHSVVKLLLLVPFGVALAALASLLDLGGTFIPGLFLGYGVAELTTLTRIRAWERAHRRLVLVDPDADEMKVWAGAPL